MAMKLEIETIIGADDIYVLRSDVSLNIVKNLWVIVLVVRHTQPKYLDRRLDADSLAVEFS